MARGRQQKWICLECKSEFSVQGNKPRFCCSCGSGSIAKAPSYELAIAFEEKEKELERVCTEMNKLYPKFSELKAKHDKLISYWKQQYQRGYISKEEFDRYKSMFEQEKSVGAIPAD